LKFEVEEEEEILADQEYDLPMSCERFSTFCTLMMVLFEVRS